MPLPLIAVIAIFCIGYLCIIFEHSINVDKAASAVLTGVVCWAVYILAAPGLIDVASLPQAFPCSRRKPRDLPHCRPDRRYAYRV